MYYSVKAHYTRPTSSEWQIALRRCECTFYLDLQSQLSLMIHYYGFVYISAISFHCDLFCCLKIWTEMLSIKICWMGSTKKWFNYTHAAQRWTEVVYLLKGIVNVVNRLLCQQPIDKTPESYSVFLPWHQAGVWLPVTFCCDLSVMVFNLKINSLLLRVEVDDIYVSILRNLIVFYSSHGKLRKQQKSFCQPSWWYQRKTPYSHVRFFYDWWRQAERWSGIKKNSEWGEFQVLH